MPVEIQVRTVPHFKGPLNGKKDHLWPGCGSTLNIQTSLLKIGRLLHKLGHFDSQLLTTVNVTTFSSHTYLLCKYFQCSVRKSE